MYKLHIPYVRLALTTLLGTLLSLSGQAAPLKNGEAAPDWMLTTIGGEQISFYQDSGDHPAIVLFWATWCEGCAELMHKMAELRDALPDKLRIYGLNIWEDGDPLSFVKDKGFDFPILLNADLVAKRYGVRRAPGLVLVDGEKSVRYVRHKESSPEEVVQALKAFLRRPQ